MGKRWTRSWRAPVCALVLVAAPALVATARADAATSPGDEAQFVANINQLRADKGVGALRVDSRLVDEARRWAGTMSTTGLHHNPNMAADAPPGWTVLGENVGEGGSVAAIEDAFANSPHHYDNIVDPRFNAVGVGVVIDNDVIWVAEEFMAGGGVPAPATPAAPSPAVLHSPPPPPPPPTPSVVQVADAAPSPIVVDEVTSLLAQLRALEGFGLGR
jgi:hypothetical protein